MSLRSRLRCACTVLSAALLGGCAASLQPVADFGAAANALAASYKPFAAGLGESCAQRWRYRALADAGAFDEASAESGAQRACAPLRDAAHTAAVFGQALTDYASALAALAATKPSTFDGELRDLSSSIVALPASGGGALFDKRQVGAARELASGAARMLLPVVDRRLVRATLEAQRGALEVVVAAMKTYAVAIYGGQLTNTRELMQGELGRLVAASYAPSAADVEARLPWRFAQSVARDDLAANELALRRVHAFARSADALLAAHAALIENFDHLGGTQRLAAVADFVAQVQALRDDAAAL